MAYVSSVNISYLESISVALPKQDKADDSKVKPVNKSYIMDTISCFKTYI